MKKRKIGFLLLMASFSFCLLSCDNNANQPNNQINENDNELAKNAYAEYKKSFDDLSYDEFLSKSKKEDKDNIVSYELDNFYIEYELNNPKLKIEYTYTSDKKEKTAISYDYINNSWQKVKREIYYYFSSINKWLLASKSKFINNKFYSELSVLYDDNGNYLVKTEDELDQSGNLLASLTSKYVNNEWVYAKREEYTYDNNGDKATYLFLEYKQDHFEIIEKSKYVNGECYKEIEVETDQNYNYKLRKEYLYDNDNNLLSEYYYRYIDDSWEIISQYKYFTDKKVSLLIITFDEENNYQSKVVTKYDESGNLLERNDYIYHNGWQQILKAKTINGKVCIELQIDTTENKKTESSFDESGNVLEEIIYENNNGSWINSSKTVYTYNELGKVLTKGTSIYKNQRWYYSEKEEYEYNNTGDLVKEAYFKYINNVWEESERYIYINDKKYQEIELTFYPDGRIYSKYEHIYDEKGNVVFYGVLSHLGGWHYFEKREYEYDNDGYKTSEKIYELYDDIVGLLLRTIIEYSKTSSGGSKSVNVRYDADGSPMRKMETEYDRLENKIYYAYYDYKNDNWEPRRIERLINGKMRIELQLNDGYTDGSINKYESTYDELGNCLTWIVTDFIDNEWIYNEMVEYTYDNKGNKIISISSYYKKGKWEYDTKTEYTYDDEGNKLTTKYYHFVNGEWV